MKYLCQSPTLAGKLSRWLLLLSEFDIEYVTRKVIKGRAVAEFLANQAIPNEGETSWDFPDEHLGAITEEPIPWTMYFDGVVNQYGAGLGVILVPYLRG